MRSSQKTAKKKKIVDKNWELVKLDTKFSSNYIPTIGYQECFLQISIIYVIWYKIIYVKLPSHLSTFDSWRFGQNLFHIYFILLR